MVHFFPVNESLDSGLKFFFIKKKFQPTVK
jgi:hypothetical protein